MLKKTASIALVAAVAAAFMFASVGASEAKGKKKKMAAPAKSPICMTGAPVCASKGGMKFTYANACFAANDGATKIKAGACKPPKKAKKAKAKKAAAPAPAAKPAAAPAGTTGAAAPANAKK